MAGGFAKDGAVQEQIEATVDDAVRHAREQLSAGESLSHCENCGDAIPEARRAALPGVRRCLACQASHDAQQKLNTGFNRRGSKDSQLR